MVDGSGGGGDHFNNWMVSKGTCDQYHHKNLDPITTVDSICSCSAFVCYACAMAQESRELDSYLLQQQQELKQQQQQQQQKQPRGRNSMPISTDFVIDISKQKR
jgi:hypothetical protein